jgi:CheY-like chemotaxis protein
MTPGPASSGAALHGLSVLVVEDETIVSLLIEGMLTDLGCDDVWYASGVEEGLTLLDARTPDAAVLDVNLAGQPVYPIARRLADAGVPFVFATGYGASGVHEDWSGRPVLQKPFQSDSLGSALSSALGARNAADISH